MRHDIRLAGKGGQGQILAGIILAEAAVTYDGFYATQAQSYGPESRGGASQAEVIISDEPIDYPKVTNADMLLCMSQEAYEKYKDDLKEDGLVLIDDALVESDGDGIEAPITRIAEEDIGLKIVANIVAVGIIVGLSKVVSEEAARNAILSRVPEGTEDVNEKAFMKGLEIAEKLETE